MICVRRRKFGIPYHIHWFDPAPQFHVWPLTIFYQSPGKESRAGLVRQAFHTLHSDLSVGADGYLAAMNSSTRNQVHQMIRQGLMGTKVGVPEFTEFHNLFAADKAIAGTSVKKLKSLGESVWLTAAIWQNRALAMHATVVDPETGRARSLLSASARFEEPEERKLIGKANRWLHWWDMCQLHEAGIGLYDWGGVAKNSVDPDKQGINQFKEGFGGFPVEESHYYPVFLKSWGD